MAKKIKTHLRRHAHMAKMFKAGNTLQAIADKYGVSRQRIHQILKSMGITWRDGGYYVSNLEEYIT